jgi:hypothetical protein
MLLLETIGMHGSRLSYCRWLSYGSQLSYCHFLLYRQIDRTLKIRCQVIKNSDKYRDTKSKKDSQKELLPSGFPIALVPLPDPVRRLQSYDSGTSTVALFVFALSAILHTLRAFSRDQTGWTLYPRG